MNLRSVILRFRNGSLKTIPFSHPLGAEWFIHLIPQMQVDGNELVQDVVGAKLSWICFGQNVTGEAQEDE